MATPRSQNKPHWMYAVPSRFEHFAVLLFSTSARACQPGESRDRQVSHADAVGARQRLSTTAAWGRNMTVSGVSGNGSSWGFPPRRADRVRLPDLELPGLYAETDER